jgi:phosphatidate cytidylyltransferase
MLLGWLGSHFFRLRGVGEMAAQWTALAMITNWTADSGGYVFGTTLGRRRLSPRLSPNKTVEGYLGGLAAGVLAAAIVALVLDLELDLAIFLGILISTLGPAGDLGISLLKRSVGLKDSGSFLPGHGGALDRTDSLMWAVALTYYVVLLTG